MDPDRVQFSAKFETPFFVTNTAVASVRDVLICATDAGAVELDDEEWREHPPIGSPWQLLHENPWLQREDPAPFDLGRGVTVERLSDDEAEPVMNARSPRGHNFAPIRSSASGTRLSSTSTSRRRAGPVPLGWRRPDL